MICADKATQILVALLKKYNISNIVVSPGARNLHFVLTLQNDPFFKLISVVDERSAAYVAVGMAEKLKEPVVITCTGATSSRNYLPALTEAYYAKIPVIAITCFTDREFPFTLAQQYVDRSVSQNDVKVHAVRLESAVNGYDEFICKLKLNYALSRAFSLNKGPIHIDLLTEDRNLIEGTLPEVSKIDCYNHEDLSDATIINTLKAELKDKKVALFIGQKAPISEKEQLILDKFITSWNVAVFYEHSSCYKGQKGILHPLFTEIVPQSDIITPDIMIDIGGITSSGANGKLCGANTKVWRLSEDSLFKRRRGNLVKFFDCSLSFFFSSLSSENIAKSSYYQELKNLENNFVSKIDFENEPLGSTYIAYKFISHLNNYKNCTLQLAILSAVASSNLFYIDKSVDVWANLGGFGIDGTLSTLFGRAIVSQDKLAFAFVGDLAFLYDMNILANRDLPNNIRIIINNNTLGRSMKNGHFLEEEQSLLMNDFVCAQGHTFGDKVKNWVEACNFIYYKAETKEELNEKLPLLFKQSDKPIVLEVVTKENTDWLLPSKDMNS